VITQDIIQIDCVHEEIGVTSMEENMTENQLRWFGHRAPAGRVE